MTTGKTPVCNEDCFRCPHPDCIITCEDPEKRRERQKLWQHAHPDKMREYHRRYYQAHRAEIRLQKQQYYQANRDAIRAQQKKYRDRRKEDKQ